MTRPSRATAARQGISAIATAGMVALALAPRFVFFSQLRATPFFLLLVSDSALYLDAARAILGGGAGATLPFLTPLYPFFLAVILALNGSVPVWARVIQCVVGAATCVLVSRIGLRLWNRRAGLIAGTLCALYPPFWWYDNAVLVESPIAALFVLFVLFAVRTGERRSSADAAIAGAAGGLATVLRGTYAVPVLAVGIALLVLVRRTPRRGGSVGRLLAVYALCALLPSLPFAIRNTRIAGRPAPVSMSFGFNLAAGNDPASPGLYRVPPGVDLRNDPGGAAFARNATGRNLDALGVSDYWRDRTLAWMRAHPVEELGLLARKLAVLLGAPEYDQLGLSAAFLRREYGTTAALPIPSFAIVLPFALAGIVLFARKSSSTALAVTALATAAAPLLVFFVNGRMRLALSPVAIAFSAAFLDAAWTALRTRKPRPLAFPIAVGLAVVVVAAFFQPAYRETFEQEYGRLGQFAFDRGDYVAAERRFASALRERETPDALVNLGNALAAQRRNDEAQALYDRALAANPRSAVAHFNAGNLAMQRGDAQAAYRSWRASETCNPSFAPARRNLGLLLARAGRLREALAEFRAYLALETDPARRAEIARDAAAVERAIASGKGGITRPDSAGRSGGGGD